MHDKCRACGETQDRKYQFNVFSALSHQPLLLISDILNSSCGLNIQHDDTLPKNICGKCFGYIHVFFVFRKRCQKANIYFNNNTNALQNKSTENLSTEEIITIENNLDKQSECIFYSGLPDSQSNDSIQIKEKIANGEKMANNECNRQETNCDLFASEITQTDLSNSTEYNHKNQKSEKSAIKIGDEFKNKSLTWDQLNDSSESNEKDLFDELYVKIASAKFRESFLGTFRRLENRFKDAQVDIDLFYKCPFCKIIFKDRFELSKHMEEYPIDKRKKGKKAIYSLNYDRLKLAIKNKSIGSDCTKINYENQIEFKHKYSGNQLNSTKSEKIHASCANKKPKKEKKRYKKRKYFVFCHICGQNFDQAHFSTHKRTHLNERQYECDICGKRFNTYSTLKQHMMLHSGKAKYKCQICSKACFTPASLRTHQRCHSNERPFACKFCDSRFRLKSHVVSHERSIHLKNRQRCEICFEFLAEKTAFKEHMYTHNGYPFICSLCPKRARTRKLLQKHLEVEHRMHVELTIIQNGIPVKVHSMTSINK